MKTPYLFNTLSFLSALFAAGAGAADVTSVVLNKPAPARGSETLFTVMPAAQTGVTAINTYGDPKMWNELFREFTLGSVGTGATTGDYDGDGKPDLVVVGKTSPFRLYRQTGDFQFSDVTEAAGLLVGDKAWNTGATFVDINNDGRLDLYICRFNSPNLLYINQGDGTFKEAAAAWGLAVKDASVMASFCDYDRDGHLDLYLQTNILNYAASFKGRPDFLFRNNGNGTFSDVSAKAGIWGPTQGHSAVWWDYNEDGWPDLYAANDFENPDKLYRNNGDGTFTDVVEAAMPHTSYSSMGTDLGDINNDGRTDFFVSDMAATSHYKHMMGIEEMGRGIWEGEMARALSPQYPFNALYLNNGTGRFFEIAHLAGLRSTDWTWSVRFADLDNDGRLDLHVTNGMIRNFMDADLLDKQNVAATLAQRAAVYTKAPPYEEANLAYRNEGSLRFTEVGRDWGLDQVGVSFGATYADFDRDGDLDILFTNYDAPPTLLRNNSTHGHRVLLRLVGTRSNRFGIGATVRLVTKSGQQVRQHTLTRGLMSADEPLVHFGVGDDTQIESLHITWPSGHEQTLTKLAADQLYTITEPAADRPPTPRPAAPSADAAPGQLFTEVSEKLDLKFTAQESHFDEFPRQILLPRRLSTSGPGVAVAPLASASGKMEPVILLPGVAFRRAPAGWERFAIPDETSSSALAVIAFEANGDALPDLYLLKGNVSQAPTTPALQDGLYLGRQDGTFTPAPDGTLPSHADCNGTVAAADYDGDGDLDLFVGGRMVPGKYPDTPQSRLLKNEGGKFFDVTDIDAPGLRQIGMVTSALWSDADNDHKPDLLLAVEWGPIAYFHNDAGRLTNRTEAAGLAQRTGWWTSLTAADVNADGLMDYVAGNFGLNTKYRATADRPVVLFAGSFDGSGRQQLIEAKYEGDKLYPERGRSKLAYAMPSLRRKFKTFHAFASATVEDIVGVDKLASARRLEASELASGVLLNRGGTFEFSALPTLAQIAPVFGSAAQDFDGDGYVDLCLAQNFFGPEPKTGRFDGGLSLLLRGDGRGGFLEVWPLESGIVVPGDGKALATIDWNDDQRPDILVSQNAGPLLAFENKGSKQSRGSLAVGLRHPSSANPTGVGARIQLRYAGGRLETREINAGSSHVSQSAPTAFFGIGKDAPEEIVVTWPGGKTSRHPAPKASTRLELTP